MKPKPTSELDFSDLRELSEVPDFFLRTLYGTFRRDSGWILLLRTFLFHGPARNLVDWPGFYPDSRVIGRRSSVFEFSANPNDEWMSFPSCPFKKSPKWKTTNWSSEKCFTLGRSSKMSGRREPSGDDRTRMRWWTKDVEQIRTSNSRRCNTAQSDNRRSSGNDLASVPPRTDEDNRLQWSSDSTRLNLGRTDVFFLRDPVWRCLCGRIPTISSNNNNAIMNGEVRRKRSIRRVRVKLSKRLFSFFISTSAQERRYTCRKFRCFFCPESSWFPAKLSARALTTTGSDTTMKVDKSPELNGTISKIFSPGAQRNGLEDFSTGAGQTWTTNNFESARISMSKPFAAVITHGLVFRGRVSRYWRLR